MYDPSFSLCIAAALVHLTSRYVKSKRIEQLRINDLSPADLTPDQLRSILGKVSGQSPVHLTPHALSLLPSFRSVRYVFGEAGSDSSAAGNDDSGPTSMGRSPCPPPSNHRTRTRSSRRRESWRTPNQQVIHSLLWSRDYYWGKFCEHPSFSAKRKYILRVVWNKQNIVIQLYVSGLICINVVSFSWVLVLELHHWWNLIILYKIVALEVETI